MTQAARSERLRNNPDYRLWWTGNLCTGVLLETYGGRGTVLVYSAVLALLAVVSVASRSIRRPAAGTFDE